MTLTGILDYITISFPENMSFFIHIFICQQFDLKYHTKVTSISAQLKLPLVGNFQTIKAIKSKIILLGIEAAKHRTNHNSFRDLVNCV